MQKFQGSRPAFLFSLAFFWLVNGGLDQGAIAAPSDLMVVEGGLGKGAIAVAAPPSEYSPECLIGEQYQLQTLNSERVTIEPEHGVSLVLEFDHQRIIDKNIVSEFFKPLDKTSTPDKNSKPDGRPRIDETARQAILEAVKKPDLKQLAEQIKQQLDFLYQSEGFITTKVTVQPPQVLPGNDPPVFQVETLRGNLEKIVVRQIRNGIPSEESSPGYLQSYICRRIRLGVSVPLNQYEVEDQLRLLNGDPLFASIEGVLRKPEDKELPRNEQDPCREYKPNKEYKANTESAGKPNLLDSSDSNNSFKTAELEIRFVPACDRWTGSIAFDNSSPPSVGSTRLVASTRYLSPLGFLGRLGDEFNASYYRSLSGGNRGLDVSYKAVLNPMNGTLLFRTAPNWNEVTEDRFEDLGIRGQSELYELTYRQPLQRTFRDEWALSLGFTHQSGQTFLFDNFPFPFGIGPDGDGVSRTSVVTFGQDYLHRYRSGALFLDSRFRFGTGLLDATSNSGSLPDGQFFSWLGQGQWVQRLAPRHTLVSQVSLQLTPDSLLASQQCVIGGGLSLRGYRQNARSGDNCFRFSVEDQILLSYTNISNRWMQQEIKLMLTPFWDGGLVWNHPDNPNGLPERRFLTSVGVGLTLEGRPVEEREAKWRLRVDYGLPLVKSDTGDGDLQDAGVYFNFSYRL